MTPNIRSLSSVDCSIFVSPSKNTAVAGPLWVNYRTLIAMEASPFIPDKSKWIWAPGFDDSAAKGQFVLFRKSFEVASVPASDVLLHVSADTRYRLYLNGESISFGPAKSYLTKWYYDTVNITPHIKAGVNVLAATVLRFSSSHDGCLSMVRSSTPGFLLSCQLGVRYLEA